MPSPGRRSAIRRASSSGSPKCMKRPPLHVPTAVRVGSAIAADGTRPGPLACARMECRHGVLALGDSITNGGGELQWGVALQSWALWVARGLALPYTGHAVDGARIGDVVREQLPRLELRPDARYDLGCLYAGVNDVRAPGWDPEAFAA